MKCRIKESSTTVTHTMSRWPLHELITVDTNDTHVNVGGRCHSTRDAEQSSSGAKTSAYLGPCLTTEAKMRTRQLNQFQGRADGAPCRNIKLRDDTCARVTHDAFHTMQKDSNGALHTMSTRMPLLRSSHFTCPVILFIFCVAEIIAVSASSQVLHECHHAASSAAG